MIEGFWEHFHKSKYRKEVWRESKHANSTHLTSCHTENKEAFTYLKGRKTRFY